MIKVEPVRLGEEVKNFDQWTEALSRDIDFQSDEENTKVFLSSGGYVDDDFEEEE